MTETVAPLSADSQLRLADLQQALAANLARPEGESAPIASELHPDGNPSRPAAPTRGALRLPGELPVLQRLLDARRPAAGLLEPEIRDQLAAGFGALLARELSLTWVEVTTPDGGSVDAGPVELALQYRNTDIVFYPWRLLDRQLATERAVDLTHLFRNTKDYLVTLQRFLFAERKAVKRAAAAAAVGAHADHTDHADP